MDNRAVGQQLLPNLGRVVVCHYFRVDVRCVQTLRRRRALNTRVGVHDPIGARVELALDGRNHTGVETLVLGEALQVSRAYQTYE